MPKFPSVERRVSSQSAGVVTQDPNAGGEGSRAIQQFGKQVAEVSKQALNAYRNTQAVKAAAEAQKEISSYSNEIQNGNLDDQGRLVGVEDPAKHRDLYNQKVEEVRNKYKDELDGTTYSRFQNSFEPMAARQSITVDKFAVDKFKEEGLANLGTAMDSLADLEASADIISKPNLRTQADGMVDRAIADGLIGPKQGDSMKKQHAKVVVTSDIIEGIRNDPDSAIVALQSGVFDAATSPVERERFINAAVAAKQAKKDNAAKRSTNPAIYSNLLARAMNGEDVREDAARAFKGGLLKEGSFNYIVSDVEKFSSEFKASNWRKNGADFIETALRPNPYAKHGFEPEIQANQLQAFIDWSAAHPNATREEADFEARALVKEGKLTAQRELTINKPIPRDLVGTLQKPDIGATFRALEAKYKAGGYDKFQFDRQVLLLQDWQHAFSDQEERTVKLREARNNND